MTRPYEKLSETGCYWTIRVPVRYKAKARELAVTLSTTPAQIARDGIEKELEFLQQSLRREEEDK